MKKLPKFFLTVSLIAFAVGAVVCFGHIGAHPSWAVALPLGAIFFGFFLNAYMLQGEVAKFDEETRLCCERIQRQAPATRSVTESRSEREPMPATGAFFAANCR